MKCSAFWKHTNIRPGNRVFPCCRFKTPVAEFTGDLEAVLHSKAYEQLRTKSENGEHIAGCEKCYYEESIGHKSLRQEFNEQYNTDSVGLEYIEIGIDNLCNMACDGCNSEFSTKWIAKEELIYGTAQNKYLDTETVTSVPSTVKKILFVGGESLLTERHLDVLGKHSNPEICTVIYNTNASVIPSDECLAQWRDFKRVHFIISIDGVGETQERVREGAQWQDLLDFVAWCETHNFEFEFNTVLHLNNCDNLDELIAFVKPYNRDWYINVLTYPKHLDIANHDRQTLEKLLSSYRTKDFPNKDYICNHIENSLHQSQQ